MVTVILVVHLFLAIVLVATVLLQRSEGGGLGMGSGGGGMGGFMTSRSTTSMLTRATGITAAAFMATSLLLAILSGGDRETRSILDKTAPATSEPAAPRSPAPPSAPLGQ
jgi:preprotein translocase subunit SecG